MLMPNSMKFNVQTNVVSLVFLIIHKYVFLKIFLFCYVSVNSNWVHPPRATPGISSKDLPEGSGFDF